MFEREDDIFLWAWNLSWLKSWLKANRSILTIPTDWILRLVIQTFLSTNVLQHFNSLVWYKPFISQMWSAFRKQVMRILERIRKMLSWSTTKLPKLKCVAAKGKNQYSDLEGYRANEIQWSGKGSLNNLLIMIYYRTCFQCLYQYSLVFISQSDIFSSVFWGH